MVAFLLLLVLQRSFAALSFSLGWFGRYLKAQPLLIVYRGKILWDAAKKEQLGELEILGGIRNSGTAALEDVLAMVLEPDEPSASFRSAPQSQERCPLRCVTFAVSPSSRTNRTKRPAKRTMTSTSPNTCSESPHVLACRKAVQNTGSLLR